MKFLPLIIAGIIISQKMNAQEVTKNAEKVVADSTAAKKGLMNPDNVHQLKEVLVSSKKPLYEVKIDKTVINVDASPSNAGSNVIEVLEKAPGVSVDKDRNISLKNKQSVLVMIDGRPTYLTPTDLYNYLKSTPSTSIDQIELMTNPPAKFDASGNAGVINIKTKKNKTMGFNGTYNGSIGKGEYYRNNNSLNLNYRKNKLNVFTNLGHSNWEGFNDLNISRKYFDGNNKLQAIFDQNSYSKNENNNYLNGKLGFDYAMSNKTNIGAVFNGFNNPDKTKNSNISFLKNSFNIVDSIVKSVNDMSDTWKNISSNFYIQHKLIA
jgi:outer membrane receptor protein involved in Fe transport